MTPSFLTLYFCGSEHCTPRPFLRSRRASSLSASRHFTTDVAFISTKEQTYALSRPEMLFSFLPAEVTYYQADEAEPWSYAWVGFDGKAVPEILKPDGFFRCLRLPE